MTKLLGNLIVAAGIAIGTTGVALAEGDGGDNSMSIFTGESYAAFHGSGAAASPEPVQAAEPERTQDTVLGMLWLRVSPFSDHTAA